ncbi:hypothetical protein G9A89_021421 [Geosiphon pyriformis]|nr:hypothetical protein G9A89_021421 [Geosiphon pyriformis]
MYFGYQPATGSWADQMEDLPSAPAASFSGENEGGGFSDRGSRGGFNRSYSRDSRYESRDSPRDTRFSSRAERPPQPLPTSPPFTAHLGNLPFDLTEQDIQNFFHESKISNIRILRDREDKPKGFGYVEFDDLVSLTKALELSGETIRNRVIRVSVAEPPRERDQQEDRTAGEWRRAPRDSPSSSPRNDRFGSGDRYGHREDRWSGRSEPRESRESRERNTRSDRGDSSPRGDRVDRPERGGFRDRNDRSMDRTDRSRIDTDWKGGAFSNRGNSFRDRRPEERPGTSNTSPPPPSSFRKRLDLKPRSNTAPATNTTATTATTAITTTTTATATATTTIINTTETTSSSSPTLEDSSSSSSVTSAPRVHKPNPFGDAKPIDSDEALRRFEERRKLKEKEREEKELAEKELAEKEKSSDSEKVIITKENGDG